MTLVVLNDQGKQFELVFFLGVGLGVKRHAPYAGLQGRDIKALSDQPIADLRADRGMSLALPAELNGYPGPAHSLELAERALDRLFKDKRVVPASLTSATSKAATAQGSLREAHLRYHLAMMDVLTPEQVAQYNRLRGY